MLKPVTQLHVVEQPLRPGIAQLVERIKSEIENEARPPGSRLPSIRAFAREQGASRYAVVEAYERLAASGYIVSRPGSGFFVDRPRRRPVLVEPDAGVEYRAFDVAWLIRDILEAKDNILNVGGPWLPDDWMDVETMQSILRALARGPSAHLLRYGSPKGYLPLRDQLQLMLHEAGIEADREQIVLTNGTSQALDLVIRYFLKPGDTVLVEDPGYYNLFGYLRACDVRLVGVPRLADGPDLEALRHLARKERPKLFFVQSAAQNPTGSDIGPSGLYRVLQMANEFGFHIVEDDTYGDIAASAGPRLASLDRLERVIYVRSFSKTLSGSLRAGFVAASSTLAEALTNLKVLSCIATSEFTERFVYHMLIEGHYRKYISRLKQGFAAKRAEAHDILVRHGLEIFTMPTGGNLLWARFPGIADSAPLARLAKAQNIVLGPGAVFRPNLEPSPFLRFNVMFCGDPRLSRFLSQFRDQHRVP